MNHRFSDKFFAVSAVVAGIIGLFLVMPTAAQNIGDIMNEIEKAPDEAPSTVASVPTTAAGEEQPVDLITASHLQEAGFSGVEAIPEEKDKYQRPVFYFRVNETVFDDYPSWGEAANLVAVTLYEVENKALLSSASRALHYREIHGRYQARFTKSGRYIVVTGPSEQKVANLAKVIEGMDFED